MASRDAVELALEVLADAPEAARPCGPHIVQVLERVLAAFTPTSSLKTTAQRCLMLKRLSDDAIATYPYADVPDHWRRLYMDASLLYVAVSVSHLNEHDSEQDKEKELLEMVRLLDMANIVTGYFENGRMELLFKLLEQVQARLPRESLPASRPASPSLDSGRNGRPSKKRRLSETVETGKSRQMPSDEEDPALLLPNIPQIKRYTPSTAPDITEISACSGPFIVTGGVSDWPALSDDMNCAWKSANYLRNVAGRGRIVPVEVGSSYTAQGWTQKMMDFDDFLRDIEWDEHQSSAGVAKQHDEETPDEQPLLYLAQHDLFQQFPALLADISTPDYVFSGPPAPHYFPAYKPPSTVTGYTVNAWMGPKGTYSPAHTDPYYNCYAQVVGRKHLWIAPPQCTSFMEALNEPTDEEGEEDLANSLNGAAEQYMDNTARLDVFHASRSAAAEFGPNAEGKVENETFKKHVLPHAQQAILHEGDLLFMPPRWWHSLKALDRSFSVSMWF